MDYPLTLKFSSGNLPAHYSPQQFNAYKEEQASLRNQVNARCVQAGRKPVFSNPTDDFSNYAVQPIEGGRFKIVKREKPIDVVEFDNDGHASVIASMTKTHADRIGLSCSRGKYNDGHRLAISESASIELGEVQQNGGGF